MTTISERNAGIKKSGIHKHELSSSFRKIAATMKNTTITADSARKTMNSISFRRSGFVYVASFYKFRKNNQFYLMKC